MDDKIKVTAQDVAAQRQAMKKPGAAKAPAAAPAVASRPAVTAPANPMDLIDKTFSLAQECGGIEQLKRLVDRLAGE